MNKIKLIILPMLAVLMALPASAQKLVYEIDYSTTDWEFYVMGYTPEKGDGCIVSKNPMEGDDGGPSWYQYFIADQIPTKTGESYTVVVNCKASEDITVGINMGWGWNSTDEILNERLSISTEWKDVRVDFQKPVGGTQCNLVLQPGGATATIYIKSVKVYQNMSGRDFEFEGLTYTVLDEDALTCQTKEGGYSLADAKCFPGNDVSGELVIPETVSDGSKSFSVVKIGSYSFARSGLTSIVFPSTVTTVGAGAFIDCFDLAKIQLTESVSKLEPYAFAWCTGLYEINLPSTLKEIPTAAFYKSGYRQMQLPESLVSVGPYAFGYSGISLETLPPHLETIGDYAFCATSGIDKMTFPESLVSIGIGAFSDGTEYASYCYLRDAVIPASVQSIGAFAFNNLWNEFDVQYDAVTPVAFSESLFNEEVYSRSTLNVPNAALADVLAVTPWNRFARINAKDGSIAPPEVTERNFDYEGITYVVIDEVAKTCKVIDSWYSSEKENIPDEMFEGDLVIPSVVSDGTDNYTVVEIGSQAFGSCYKVKSVILPETIKAIGSSAFSNSTIASIVLPESLTHIGESAFRESDLNSITIPKSIKYLGPNVFLQCKSLETVIFPETLTVIGSSFGYCESLKTIKLPSSLVALGTGAFDACWNLEINEWPESLESIGVRAMSGKFGDLSLPNNLRILGEQAFWGCDMSSLTLPASLEYIGRYAFDKDKLTAITYNASNPITAYPDLFYVEGAEDYHFNVYTDVALNMPNATLEAAESVLPWGLFDRIYASDGVKDPGLVNGKDFEYDGLVFTVIDNEAKTCRTKAGNQYFGTYTPGSEVSGDIVIPAVAKVGDVEYDVVEIGEYSFVRQALTSVVIPESVKIIENFAFEDCKELTSIDIPESVTTMAYQVFYGCTALKSAVLPASLDSIGSNMFDDCIALTSVTYNAVTPLASDWNMFEPEVYENAVLNMPNATLETVQSIEPWMDFKKIVAKDGSIGGDLAAGDDFEYEGLVYTVLDAEAKTCRTKHGESGFDSSTPGNNVTGDIVIPSIAKYGPHDYTVVEIGHHGFSNCTDLSSISLPATLRSIGGNAFSNCSKLSSIEIPDSVFVINSETFVGCTQLHTVKLPEKLSSIGQYGFYKCESLTSLNIPESVTTIENYAFSKCNKLESINIPENIIHFGQSVFSECESLTSIRIPESMTTIPESTFSGCSSLASIEIPNSITEIGGSAFSTCKNLSSIDIPESVTAIGASAFFACSNLETVTLPSKITEIGKSTFEQSPKLKDIEIPDSVRTIGERAFWRCSNLTSVHFSSNLNSIGNRAFEYCSSLEAVDLPEGVLSIGEGQMAHTFYECTNLKTLKLPSTLTVIPPSAFYWCRSLESVAFSEGLKEIGFQAFAGSINLQEINLPSSLESLGAQAFWNGGCVKVSIPAAISSIGNLALEANNIEEVEYLASEPITCEETIFNPSTTYWKATLKMPNATLADVQATTPWNKFGKIIAKDGSIGFGASDGEDFEYEGVWYTVISSENKTCATRGQQYDSELGNYVAGNNCSGDLVIPKTVSDGTTEYTVTEIGIRSFKGNELTSVSIPDGVTVIRIAAFEECRSLTSVRLPETLTLVDGTAFQVCIALNSINWPASLKRIDGGAFNYCRFTSLELPEGLEEIGKWAFQGNPLSSVSLPASLQSVEEEPFHTCTGIAEVNYAAAIPVAFVESMFENEVYQTATLNTPNATLEAVQSTVPWNLFKRAVASDGEIGFKEPVNPGEPFEFDGIVYTVLDGEAMLCRIEVSNNPEAAIEIPEQVPYNDNVFTVVSVASQAFAGSGNLVSISLPASIQDVGNGVFDGCERLSSLVWRGVDFMPVRLLESIDNPNLLVYVDDDRFAPESLDHNVIANGICENLVVTPGYPFHPYAAFTANRSSLTKEFMQQTAYDGCAGWETIVLPFSATRITSPEGKPLKPFGPSTDVKKVRPFWLYEADPAGEWMATDTIKAGMPYLIAMPNNPRYNPAYNVQGAVTFSSTTPQVISSDITAPYVVSWASGAQFHSLWMPLMASEASTAMGLNVNMTDIRDDNGTLLAPGSAFCKGVEPKPLEAYVTGSTAKAFPIKGLQTAVLMLEEGDGLTVEQEGAMLMLKSAADRQVDIYSADGTLLRRVSLRAGQPVFVDGLPQGVCLVAGRKVMIR